jgi:REP element-mobilizing transposase RayT
MPRAHRYFIPGQVWHITHRCHKKEFLLKFARDRDAYLDWLFQARKRFGLVVLNYVVTSNHIHLLVQDTGTDVISQSVQLVAGRTAQQYNLRKARKGAFWEDRYHATAIETDHHLHRCIAYIDLNMVRAGVVLHPEQWEHSGFNQIQNPPQRYRLIDLERLAHLCAMPSLEALQSAHREWVSEALAQRPRRDERWSEAIAVGGKEFIERVQRQLGLAATHRKIEASVELHALREEGAAYEGHSRPEKGVLSVDNGHFWNEKILTTES